MLSKITRLGGAILACTQGTYYLVGDLKEPCDFSRHGFETPEQIKSESKQAFIELKVIGPVTSDEEIVMTMETEGRALAELLFKRFIITRNCSVSERLWRVAICSKDADSKVDARWLEQMPDEVWNVVRENILKCL